MTFLRWRSEFKIHHEEIDEQHHELVDLLNSLYETMKNGTLNEARGEVLDRMIEHTRRHFAVEEKLMNEEGFPGLLEHRTTHQALIKQIESLRARHRAGALILSNEVLTFLREWLMDHMKGMDGDFGVFLKQAAQKRLAP